MSIKELESSKRFRMWRKFLDNNGNVIEQYLSLDFLTCVQISRKHMKYRVAENGQITYSEIRSLSA